MTELFSLIFEFALLVAVCAYLMGITWLFYLALMNLRINKDELTRPAKIFAYPILGTGLVLDVLLNVIVGTFLFAELPREFLFTTRCERHLKQDTKRGKQARWWCRNFLDPFDKNNTHCRG